jgi:hypothetical protein
MTETGLLIAQIVFLVLLFGFIAAIVRSSARQLGRVQAPRVTQGPVVDPPRAPTPAAAAPPPVPAAPEPVRQPTLEPFPSPAAGADAELAAVASAAAADAPPAAAALPRAPDGVGDDAASTVDSVPEPAAEPPEDAFDILTASTQAVGAPLVDLTSGITPRLVVVDSPGLEPASELELEDGVTIGRSAVADLALSDQYVSHMHARIVRRGHYHFVEDLGSTNGTFLNDLRVERSAQLKVHDMLRMGQTRLRYEE